MRERERERYIVDCRAQSGRPVSKLLQKDRCFIGNPYTSDRESCSLLSMGLRYSYVVFVGKRGRVGWPDSRGLFQ